MFHILLIEDDNTLFHEMKERLTGWSFAVHGIKDFSRVIREFSEIKPDLVIIDVRTSMITKSGLISENSRITRLKSFIPCTANDQPVNLSFIS